MSHTVITCTCGAEETCPVPGHGSVPLEVDPETLVAAGQEALGHLFAAEQAIIAARRAWVARGLPGSNPFPQSLDHLTMSLKASRERFQRWTAAAQVVADRRAAAQ